MPSAVNVSQRAQVQGVWHERFNCVVRAFAGLFPGRSLGGGALCVYLDGEPVVDVWAGFADRRGSLPWSADTAAMVFSASKGLSATVIHRLVDRGLLSYDVPVASYWPDFGKQGKASITVRDVLRHRAGLSGLRGATKTDLMDPHVMEQCLADAPSDRFVGQSAYHAISFGWLLSGLARSVTGMGMRELYRRELARPLQTDGIHLGRPPLGSPTTVADIIMPQSATTNAWIDRVAPHVAALPFSAIFGALYFPGFKAVLQGDAPILDGEIPSMNAVVTARALARMYGAIANGGQMDGQSYLSPGLTAGLSGERSWSSDRNIVIPLSFNLGYHGIPGRAVMPGFGHVGMGGSVGWADPQTGMSYAFVHNRLVSPMFAVDNIGFVALNALIRRGVAMAREHGVSSIVRMGAPFREASAAR
jgi:CubicO group peptidase (beta-lactamase class C family)